MFFSPIESKFMLFEEEGERSFIDSSETDETSFRLPPEAFNPVHLRSPTGMLTLSGFHRPIVSSPSLLIDSAFHGDRPSNNRLHGGFSAVRDTCRVDLHISLEDPKDNRFTIRPSSSFSFDISIPKVVAVDFRLSAERRWRFTELRNAFSNNPRIPIHRNAIQSGQEGQL